MYRFINDMGWEIFVEGVEPEKLAQRAQLFSGQPVSERISPEQAALAALCGFVAAQMLIGTCRRYPAPRSPNDHLLAEKVGFDLVAEGVRGQVHRCRQRFDAG